MDHATLSALRDRHPAWRLLTSPHAPLVASFLRRVFVAPNVRVMSEADLAEALENELFGHATSFLMDQETLLVHRLHWGEEPQPLCHDLSRLTSEEAVVYNDIRFDRYQAKLRLEQERIGFEWVCDRLARMC